MPTRTFPTVARRLVMTAGILLSASNISVAVTIDDFSVGPITLTRPGATGVNALQTGLDPNHVLGGSRFIEVGDNGDPGQSLTIDTALRQLQFTVPPEHDRGYFDLTYGSVAEPLNVDLTADGADAFLLELAGPEGITLSTLNVVTAAGSSNLGGSTLTERTTLPDGRVRVRFPFSAYPSGLDFTAVQRIELSFFRLTPTNTPTLLSFSTIPEPGSIVLLAISATALRRHSRHKAVSINLTAK